MEAGHTINEEYLITVGTPILVSPFAFINVRHLLVTSVSPIWPFFCRYSQPNRIYPPLQRRHGPPFVQPAVHCAAHDDVMEGSNRGRRKRVAQNQNVDARSSRIVVPSQSVIGFPHSTPTNVQVNQVAGPWRLLLSACHSIYDSNFYFNFSATKCKSSFSFYRLSLLSKEGSLT